MYLPFLHLVFYFAHIFDREQVNTLRTVYTSSNSFQLWGKLHSVAKGRDQSCYQFTHYLKSGTKHESIVWGMTEKKVAYYPQGIQSLAGYGS